MAALAACIVAKLSLLQAPSSRCRWMDVQEMKLIAVSQITAVIAEKCIDVALHRLGLVLAWQSRAGSPMIVPG